MNWWGWLWEAGAQGLRAPGPGLTMCWSLSRCTTRAVHSPMGTKSGEALYSRSRHRAALCFTLSMLSLWGHNWVGGGQRDPSPTQTFPPLPLLPGRAASSRWREPEGPGIQSGAALITHQASVFLICKMGSISVTLGSLAELHKTSSLPVHLHSFTEHFPERLWAAGSAGGPVETGVHRLVQTSVLTELTF